MSFIDGGMRLAIERAVSDAKELAESARMAKLLERRSLSVNQAREGARVAKITADISQESTPEQMRSALREIPFLDETVRADALVRLTYRASPRWMGALLAEAEELTEDDPKAMVLIALAPRLPGPLMDRALAIANSIQSDSRRNECVDYTNTYNSHEMLKTLINSSMAIGDQERRKVLLRTLYSMLNQCSVSNSGLLGRCRLVGEFVGLTVVMLVRRVYFLLTRSALKTCMSLVKRLVKMGFILFLLLCVLLLTEVFLYLIGFQVVDRDPVTFVRDRLFLWCIFGAMIITYIIDKLNRWFQGVHRRLEEPRITIPREKLAERADIITANLELRRQLILSGLFRSKSPSVQAIKRLKRVVRCSSDNTAKSVIEIALSLDRPQLYSAYAMARAISDDVVRADALSALSSMISNTRGSSAGSLYAQWRTELHIHCKFTREQLCNILNTDNKGLLIEALGGEEGLKASTVAVEDVGVWWP
jgi:hypothetical protein